MIYRYSAIDTSYRCLEKFNLQYIQGIKPDKQSGDMLFGTIMHQVIFDGLAIKLHPELKGIYGVYDAAEAFDIHWSEYENDTSLDWGRYDYKTYSEMGGVFASKFFRLHEKHYDPTYLERSIDFNVGKYNFNGTPDFIGLYDNVESLIDFKTSAMAYDKDKLLVNEQLYLYAHAANTVLGCDIKQIVYTVFVKDKQRRIQTIVHSLDQNKLQKMLENVENQCNLLSSITVFPKNRNSCLMSGRKCEFYNKCYDTN